MNNIQFEGQTKTKLGNPEARTALEQLTSEKLLAFVEDIDNQETTKTIIDKAIKAAKVRMRLERLKNN